MNLSTTSQSHRQKAANALVFPAPPPIFASDGPDFSSSIVNVQNSDSSTIDALDVQQAQLDFDLWNVDPFNVLDTQLGLDGDPFGLFESAEAMDPLTSCFTPRPVYSLFPDRDIPMLARTPLPFAPSALAAPSTSYGETHLNPSLIPQSVNMGESAIGPNFGQDKASTFVPSAPAHAAVHKSQREGLPYSPALVDPNPLAHTADKAPHIKTSKSKRNLQNNRNKKMDAPQSPSSSSPAQSSTSNSTSAGISGGAPTRENKVHETPEIPNLGAVELKPWIQDEGLTWKVSTPQGRSPSRELQHHRAGPARKDPFLLVDKPKVSKPRCTDIGPQWKARITAERNQRLDQYEAEQARIQAELAARPKPVAQPKPILYTLVKLRDTDQNSKTKGKFVWYMAREKNAKENLYLIVSGPMAGITKTVRSYDRKPHTPEIEKQLTDNKEILDTKITLPIEAIIDPNLVKSQRAERSLASLVAYNASSSGCQ